MGRGIDFFVFFMLSNSLNNEFLSQSLFRDWQIAMIAPRNFPLISRQIARILELSRSNSTFNSEILILLRRLRDELESEANRGTSQRTTLDKGSGKLVQAGNIRMCVADFLKQFEISETVPKEVLSGVVKLICEKTGLIFHGSGKSFMEITHWIDQNWESISPYEEIIIAEFQSKVKLYSDGIM